MRKLTHAAIAEQAYYLWLDDGMTHGNHEHHWTLAQKILSQQPAPVAPKKTRAKSTKAAAPRTTRARQIAPVLHA